MIYATPQASAFWKAVKGQHARTLAADKFVDFADSDSDKDWRRRSCEQIRSGKALTDKIAAWRAFCRSLPSGDDGLLFAKLRARLIVNQAGGAIENGGLSLDRNSGLPCIVGSAAKGCARKTAIILLHDEPDANKKRALLERIAWVFGWADQDWKEGRKRDPHTHEGKEYLADFCYACGDRDWPAIRRNLAESLASRLKARIERPDRPWESLPSFAGAIQFLPAFPWERDPGIELDIVTPHHMNYYEGKKGFENAPDIEEPKPNVFPVVSCQGEPVFVFTLVATRRAQPGDLGLAREWLRDGLTTWGIGGKTAAGYGWFESSAELDRETLELERQREEAIRKAEAAHLEAQRKRAEEDATRERRAREKADQAAMTPEQQADYTVAHWDDSLLRTRLLNFGNDRKRGGPADDNERLAMVRALRGPRQAIWADFRAKALKGPAATALQAVLKLCKDKGLEKP